jgi:hypothetical protein
VEVISFTGKEGVLLARTEEWYEVSRLVTTSCRVNLSLWANSNELYIHRTILDAYDNNEMLM